MTLKSLKPLLAGTDRGDNAGVRGCLFGHFLIDEPDRTDGRGKLGGRRSKLQSEPDHAGLYPAPGPQRRRDCLYRSTTPAAGRDSMLAWLLEDPRGRVRGVLHRRRGSAR